MRRSHKAHEPNTKPFQFSIADLIGFTVACSLLAFTIRALPRDSSIPVIAIVGMLYGTKFFLNTRSVRPAGAIAIYLAVFFTCLALSYAMTDWNNTDTSHSFKIVIFPLAILDRTDGHIHVRRGPKSTDLEH